MQQTGRNSGMVGTAKTSFYDQLKDTGVIVSDIIKTQTFSGCPAMLPPAPICVYIDKLETPTHPAQTKVVKNETDKQHQEHAELLLYRAFEGLRLVHNEKLIVMQNFKYSHGHYKMFVDHECTKKDEEEEGESDFVVLSEKFILILEVKAPKDINEKSFLKDKSSRFSFPW